MSDTPKARLIVPDEMTRGEFRSIARDRGWIPYKIYDVPGDTYEEVWTVPDHTAALHYVEDVAISHQRFLLVRSDRVRALVPEIESAFRTIPISALCAIIIHGKDIAERIRSVTRLGVVAFELTPQVRVAWETGLFHPDEGFRLATLRAMSFIGSPQLLSLLEEAARDDPSDRAREYAARLIDAIRRHAPGDAANDSAVHSPG
jgi:hypothetical protein